MPRVLRTTIVTSAAALALTLGPTPVVTLAADVAPATAPSPDDGQPGPGGQDGVAAAVPPVCAPGAPVPGADRIAAGADPQRRAEINAAIDAAIDEACATATTAPQPAPAQPGAEPPPVTVTVPGPAAPPGPSVAPGPAAAPDAPAVAPGDLPATVPVPAAADPAVPDPAVPGTTVPGAVPTVPPAGTVPDPAVPGSVPTVPPAGAVPGAVPGTTVPGTVPTVPPAGTVPGAVPGTTVPGTVPTVPPAGAVPGATAPGTTPGTTAAPGTPGLGAIPPGTSVPGTVGGSTAPGTTAPATTAPGADTTAPGQAGATPAAVQQVPVGPQPYFLSDFKNGFADWGTCQSAAINGDCTADGDGHSIELVPQGGPDGGPFARFIVNDGDVASMGGERAEVRDDNAGATVKEGDERWYEWSMRPAADFPDKPGGGWFIVMQWHAGSGSPPLAIDLSRGHVDIGGDGVGGPRQTIGPIHRGEWTRYVLHAKFSRNSDEGFVEAWENGVRTVPLTKRATMTSDSNYLKQGIYRDESASGTAQIDFSDMRVTGPPNQGDVQPKLKDILSGAGKIVPSIVDALGLGSDDSDKDSAAGSDHGGSDGDDG